MIVRPVLRVSYESPQLYTALHSDLVRQYGGATLCIDSVGTDTILTMFTGTSEAPRAKTMANAWRWLSKPMLLPGALLHIDADSKSMAALDMTEFDMGACSVYGASQTDQIAVSTGAMLMTKSACKVMADYLLAVKPAFPRYASAKYDLPDLAEVDYVFCCMCIGLGIKLVATDQIACGLADVTDKTRLVSNAYSKTNPEALQMQPSFATV